jgi:hypothetical protein
MKIFLSPASAFFLVYFRPWQTSAEPLWSDVCTQDETKNLPFCDIALNLDDRVADYVKRIPLETQISMMGHQAKGYDDLKIPPYMWWSEGLHGASEPCVRYKDQCACPTNFPSPSAMGNAFNRTLYRLVGRAIGLEGRAISNLRGHDQTIGDGLTYWFVNRCVEFKLIVGCWMFLSDTNTYFMSFSKFTGRPPLTCKEIHGGAGTKRFQVSPTVFICQYKRKK